jgi:hypothetical protein
MIPLSGICRLKAYTGTGLFMSRRRRIRAALVEAAGIFQDTVRGPPDTPNSPLTDTPVNVRKLQAWPYHNH